MDEPETHLHPEVLIEVINFLKENVGTLYVATHSTALLSTVEFGNIVLIKDDVVQERRSDIYKKTLEALWGQDSELLPLLMQRLWK